MTVLVFADLAVWTDYAPGFFRADRSCGDGPLAWCRRSWQAVITEADISLSELTSVWDAQTTAELSGHGVPFNPCSDAPGLATRPAADLIHFNISKVK